MESNWDLAFKAIQKPGMKIRASHWIDEQTYIYYDGNGGWLDQDEKAFYPTFNHYYSREVQWFEFKGNKKWVKKDEIIVEYLGQDTFRGDTYFLRVNADEKLRITIEVLR